MLSEVSVLHGYMQSDSSALDAMFVYTINSYLTITSREESGNGKEKGRQVQVESQIEA